MTLRLASKQDCTGCEACVCACPSHSIELEEAATGFRYPRVERGCNDCGVCVSVCPTVHRPERVTRFPAPSVRGGFYPDPAIRRDSSSGGLFSLFADHVLARGGAVAGAMFDDELELRHRVITEPSGLPGLRGSKYLQSHIGPVFGELRGRLRRGQLSLFVGTPCQVAGLYAFLRKDYDHLVTLDLVCHGIASRRVFHKYLRHHEETAADTIVSVNFRDKRAGWKDFGVALRFASGREVVTPFRLDSFMRGFLQNLTLRPSCYGCLFNHVPRIADITLGDFWGIEDIDPRLDDDRGCSLVLLNGPKGQRLFEDTKQRLVVREFALGDAVRKNPHIVSSAKAPRNAAQFYADLETEPFARVIQQYLGQRTRVARITSAVGRTVRRGLRGFMRS